MNCEFLVLTWKNKENFFLSWNLFFSLPACIRHVSLILSNLKQSFSKFSIPGGRMISSWLTQFGRARREIIWLSVITYGLSVLGPLGHQEHGMMSPWKSLWVIICLLVFKVTSTSLKTLGKVFGAANPIYITKLFNSSDIQTDSEILGEKRARLDHHLQNSNTKTSNLEKLAFMLYRRLRDSSWEVRDSTLEFVADLVQLDRGKSCMHRNEARHRSIGNMEVE